jgi:hypothetical protein
MPKTETPAHKDMFGSVVAVGDTIAYTQDNCLHIGKITNLTAKRVHVVRIGRHAWGSQQLPETFIKLDGAEVTAWILRGAKNKWNIMYDN